MSSRAARAASYWVALPRRMLQQYPEQTLFWSTFGVASAVMIVYKLATTPQADFINGPKPYYRGFYSVFRPENPVIVNWRKPEEYPAPYLTTKIPTE